MQTIAQTLAQSLPPLAPSQPTQASKTIEPPSGWKPTVDAYEPSLAYAAERCAKFIADMERGAQPYWLAFTGEFGCGKTMLARQTFERAASHCNPGRFALWTGVTRRPKCHWFTADSFAQRMGGGEWDLPEYLRDDYLVAVDDLGRAKDTANSTFADGLCRLADNRMHRWTIWTTNLALDEIGNRIDARISSRLIRDENRLVTIKAGDYALRQKQTRTP